MTSEMEKAIRQAANENHIRRVGYDASEAWLANTVRHVKRTRGMGADGRLLYRALELIAAIGRRDKE